MTSSCILISLIHFYKYNILLIVLKQGMTGEHVVNINVIFCSGCLANPGRDARLSLDGIIRLVKTLEILVIPVMNLLKFQVYCVLALHCLSLRNAQLSIKHL